jgi:hypothetical protein
VEEDVLEQTTMQLERVPFGAERDEDGRQGRFSGRWRSEAACWRPDGGDR